MFAIDILYFAFDQTIGLLVVNDAAQQRSQNINGDRHQENVYTQYLGCYRNFHWLKILNKKEWDIFKHKLPLILGDKTGYLQSERRRIHSDYNHRNKNCMKGLYLLITNTLKILQIKDVLTPSNSEHPSYQNTCTLLTISAD